MPEREPRCVNCSAPRCGSADKSGAVPPSCPSEKYSELAKETIDRYAIPENRSVIEGWLGLMSKILDPQRAREKWSWTRIDEIMEYARLREMTRLGVATCYALMPEARALSDILEGNGFDVVSVSCLCGEVNPRDVGLPGDVFCNPILQAEVLNQEETELNIMVGLCVGHDILFLRYSKAETTPLIVKDRSTGHNPVAALYQSQGFFRDRFTQT